MTIYYLLISIPSIITINSKLNNKINNLKINNFFWHAFFFILVLFIGLRYQVGTDWGAYLNIYEFSKKINLISIFFQSQIDPGYLLLNKFSSIFSLEIYSVNLISSFIFLFGVFKYCEFQKNPWLALSLCTPFLIIVVGMGYTRQAIALGIMLYALLYFYRGQNILFTILILIASTFHDTALIYLSLLLLTINKKNYIIFIIFFLLLIFLFFLIIIFFDSNFDFLKRFSYYYKVYITNSYNASGTIYRLSILVFSSVFFILFCLNRIVFIKIERRVLFSMSIIMIFVYLFCLSTNTTSTYIDRLSIYFYPIIITSISLVPQVFNKTKLSSFITTVIVLMLNFSILYVWLNYSNYSDRWLPYNFIY